MAEDHRDRRLTEAADLQKSFDALLKVDPSQRPGLIHDRLMAAVESICAKHRATKDVFSYAQMNIIKDIAFQIVHIVDPVNKPPRGFFSVLWAEWKSKSPIGKLGSGFAVITAITALFGGGIYSFNTYVRPWFPVKPPAASTPSTPAIPDAARPRPPP